MVTIYFVIAGLAVLLWLPILLKFYKAWLGRHNPVSLAICAVIILLVWSTVAGAWLVTGSLDADVVVLVTSGMSATVAAFAHIAFYWSDRKFVGTRSRKE
jgi:hypothetical protein